MLWHIREVLENIDEEQFMLDEYRAKLRLITLIHDTFKYQVDYNQPKTGNNHHGYKARVFAEKMLPTAAYADVLTVIQHHDDAYNIWNRANRGGKWSDALAKIDHFIKFLEEKMEDISLYSDFFYCDNKTGDKSMDPYNWFMYQVWIHSKILFWNPFSRSFPKTDYFQR